MPDLFGFTPNPEGEYNERYIDTPKGRYVLFSDRDGEIWDVELPNGNIHGLDASDLYSACKETLQLMKEEKDA